MKMQLPPYVHSFPAPAVLIGCGTMENPNLITCSWFGTACSEPPMVSLAIRPSRFSYGLIHESGEFSVNIPRISDLKAVIHCGTISGRQSSKFAELGLTAEPCPPLLHAPMVREFPLALACRIHSEHPLGTHHLFIAEIVAVYGNERENDPKRRADAFPREQIVYLDGKFWALAPIPEG